MLLNATKDAIMNIHKRKKRLHCTLSTRSSFKYNDIDRLKVKGWKKIYHSNTNLKSKSHPLSDKIDFRTRKITRNIT